MKTCIKAEVVDNEMDVKAVGTTKDAEGEADIRAEIRQGETLHREGNIHLDFVGKSEGKGQMSLKGKKKKTKTDTKKSKTKKLVKGKKSKTKNLVKGEQDKSGPKKSKNKKQVKAKKVMKKEFGWRKYGKVFHQGECTYRWNHRTQQYDE